MKHAAPQTAKFKRLVRKLRPHISSNSVTVDTVVVGILERLWHATIISTPQGDVGRIDNDTLAELVGWLGDASTLIDALVDTGWMDRCENHRLLIHDWQDHAPAFLKGNLAKNGRDFFSPDQTKPNLTKPNRQSRTSTTAKQGAKQRAKQFSYPADFEKFWTAFPKGRKTGKAAASTAFARAASKVASTTLIEAAREYAASDVGRGEFVKTPATWLNQGCWDDDRAAWKDRSSADQSAEPELKDLNGRVAALRGRA